MIKIYGNNPEKQIRYVDFIKDSFHSQVESSGQTKKAKEQRAQQAVEKELLLSKIKKEVKIKNLRVHEYFLDFDTLRKGFCAKNKFRGVLSQLKSPILCRIELSLEEYDFLERLYRNEEDPSKANWFQFSKDINLVFAEDVHLLKL